MKKIMCLLLVTGCMHNALGMQEDQASAEPQVSQESGYSIFALASSMQNYFVTTLDKLDQAFGAGAEQQPDVVLTDDADCNLLRTELVHKNLAQAIKDASEQKDSRTFISLLIGMNKLKLSPTPETKSVICKRLNLLQLEHRQVSKTVLEIRMAEEREVHTLRKQFKGANDQLSDDEDYTNATLFAHKVLSDK